MPNEEVGSSSDTIVNGTVESNPATYGHVFIERLEWKNGQPKGRIGSGTLVRPDWVLTAAHNLDLSNCPESNNPFGTTIFTCQISPKTHKFRLGNAPNSPVREADRVYVYPAYIPTEDENAAAGVDVALLHLKVDPGVPNPFGTQANFTKSVYSGAAGNLVGQQLRLFGYGCTSLTTPCPSGQYGTLRWANFTVGPYTGDEYDLTPVGSAQSGGGDSGGPYMVSGSNTVIAGVHRAHVVGGTGAAAVPAELFRDWFNQVLDPNTVLVANAHADYSLLPPGDFVPDAYFLLRNQVRPLFAGTWWAVKIIYASGWPPVTVYLMPDNGFPITSKAFAVGDFNKDGIWEPVFKLNNDVYYFQSPNPTNPDTWTQQTGFFLLGSDYNEFRVADFDGDGTDDLEAFDTNGYADVYWGKATSDPEPAQGLQQAESYYDGIPSTIGTDGKLMTVTGGANQTIHFPKVSIKIDVLPVQTSFDVEIFDGDLGGANDFTSANSTTCYRLFADGDDNGVPPMVGGVPQYVGNPVDSASFPDHRWKSIYRHPASQPKHPAALNAKGDFYTYTLVVELVSGTCANPTTNNTGAMNAFSVRATGRVSFVADANSQLVSFVGQDRTGPFVPTSWNGSGAPAPTRDTDYDGFFRLFIPVVTTGNFILKDADADDLDDAAELPGTWGPQDVNSPGVSFGANSAIKYDVFGLNAGGTPALLGSALNVSGNYVTTGLMDVEARQFTSSGFEYLLWDWSNVLTGNNVHVWLPENAATGAKYYAFGGKSLDGNGLRWSSAKTPEFWAANSATIAQYLPITLGLAPNNVQVTSVTQAVDILRRNYQPCGVQPAWELRELMAHLLTTRLNIAAQALNENLRWARIYGTFDTVDNALATGDRDLVKCNPTPSAIATMNVDALKLSLVGRRWVNNRW